ncbi:hypothetical protein GMLC_20550 [Geomonas limicola]|uniref:NADH:ubiquinone oxidoreductase-like 20kDa subunit domain-containing protein n=1 Tax=Geomonas limicola TaxID=2740186 RepID=A0A6V8N7D0_9BACT|nr:hypothetical protein [Geomonas limicola]GFO68476.1 hypothetical protein GMLC_20550 [Geomonas limicola]
MLSKDYGGRLRDPVSLGGTRRAVTVAPIKLNDWIGRLRPGALAVVTAGTCSTYGGIHAMEGNATGCMGLADYLG